MPAFVRIFISLLGVSALARAAEREIARQFAVQPGCTLKIDSPRGRLTIDESDAPEVKIAIVEEVAASTEAEAEKIFAKLQLDLSAEKNTVTIHAHSPRESRVQWVWNEPKTIELFYKITVPRECSVDLKFGSADITVGSLTGRHVVRADSGTIFFKRIQGSIDARLDRGNVIVSRCSGPVTAHVRQGTLRLGTVGGRVDAVNESGDIEVMQARGGIVAEATAGDVSVGFSGELGADNRVSASGGSVVAKIDATANCTIQASSVWGHVVSKLPLVIASGQLGTRKVSARLNTGGPVIALHADGGDVKIAALDFEIN